MIGVSQQIGKGVDSIFRKARIKPKDIVWSNSRKLLIKEAIKGDQLLLEEYF